MAASRIAFSQRREDGTKEIYVVDSDGENLRRVTDHGDIVASPTWSPDGRRLAYMVYDPLQTIVELDLDSGDVTRLEPGRSGNYLTPAYHPDGETVAFSVQGGNNRSGLFTWNARRQCCLTSLTEGRWADYSPTFSPDGRWVAFNSTRLGTQIPQIYVMPASGGDPRLLSPYAYDSGGFYTAPDWAPFGDRVAFNGRLNRMGRYHILVARMGDERRIQQVTREGNNEAPSWAPDGRHLVFAGERSWGRGLFVVDTQTARIRVIRRGVEVSDPDWSPALVR
jgi:TolB protein